MARLCFLLALSLTLSAFPLTECFRRSKGQSNIKDEQLHAGKSEGDHADAFQQAHDSLVAQRALKQQALNDWFSANDIAQKENELRNKQHELAVHKGETARAWWQRAWSWIRRIWQNLFSGKQKRLESEVASLQRDLGTMRAEKAHLEKQVQDMNEVIDNHRDDAQGILDGLNGQVASLRAEVDNYRQHKADSQAALNEHKSSLSEEDAAALAISTELIEWQEAALHGKRDVYYSLTATCSQFEKKGTEICHRCSGDDRACGDSCINKETKCNVLPACACDEKVGHDVHRQFKESKEALEFTIQLHNSTLYIKNQELNDADKAIEMMDQDKTKADASYATKKKALIQLKGQLEQQKAAAEEQKGKTEQDLASATEANEVAVAKLETELQAAVSKLQESQTKEKQSKTALIIAQEAKMREVMDFHGSKIAALDAHIFSAQTETARVEQQEAKLSAAIAKSRDL